MLLTGISVFDALKNEFSQAQKSIFIASAYCTKKAFDALNSALLENSISKILVVRWEPYDLLEGASDLEVYLSAKKFGWKVYINQRLHSKIAVFDSSRAILGSANFTESGLGLLGKRSNLETSVAIPASNDIIQWQQDLLNNSTQITEELYELISKEIATFDPEWKPKIAFSFTEGLQKRMREIQGALFTKDFVWCNDPSSLMNSTSENAEHDYKLLNLKPGASLDEIREAFGKLKIVKWVEDNLETELYFGRFSALLHEALQDDPKPYRQSVKSLVANLIDWLTILLPEKFQQETPNHSTKIIRL